jgi:hypothetical protein
MTEIRITWAGWEDEEIAIISKADLIRLLDMTAQRTRIIEGEEDITPDTGSHISEVAEAVAATGQEVLETIAHEEFITETRDYPARTARGQARIDAEVTIWQQHIKQHYQLLGKIVALNEE